MVVLVIIAIGLTLAVPLIEGGFDSREVRRAARQIASTMVHCRGGGALQVGAPGAASSTPSATRSPPATGAAGQSSPTAPSSSESTAEPRWVTAGGQILFYPNGSTSGADVVVASRRDRTQQPTSHQPRSAGRYACGSKTRRHERARPRRAASRCSRSPSRWPSSGSAMVACMQVFSGSLQLQDRASRQTRAVMRARTEMDKIVFDPPKTLQVENTTPEGFRHPGHGAGRQGARRGAGAARRHRDRGGRAPALRAGRRGLGGRQGRRRPTR